MTSCISQCTPTRFLKFSWGEPCRGEGGDPIPPHGGRLFLNTFGLDINSLVPGGFPWNFALVNFKLILVLDDWDISCAILIMWMSQGFTDDKSTLIQVMAWCRQATRHYLNQCWPRSKLPYGTIRQQWVKWGLVISGTTILVPFLCCKSYRNQAPIDFFC